MPMHVLQVAVPRAGPPPDYSTANDNSFWATQQHNGCKSLLLLLQAVQGRPNNGVEKKVKQNQLRCSPNGKDLNQTYTHICKNYFGDRPDIKHQGYELRKAI
jgi:hypothetical protein